MSDQQEPSNVAHLYINNHDSPRNGPNNLTSPEPSPSPQQQRGGPTLRQIAPVAIPQNGAFSNAQLRSRASPIVGRQPQQQHPHPNATASPRQRNGRPSGDGHSPTPSPPSIANGSSYPPLAPMQHQSAHGTPSLHSRLISAGGSLMSALSPKGKGHARRNSFGQRDFSPSHTHGRRTPLYLNIFFFFVGMSVAWFIIHATTSSHDPNIDHSALMQIYRQRPEVAATATETQKEAPKTSPAPIAPQQQWQQSQLPFCNVENHADGEWEFDPTITQPPYVSHEWDGTCDTIEGYHNDPTHVNDGFPKHVRRELQWHWKPRTCRLAPYSRKNFCQLLAGRNILFVGDSIAAQHVLSFVHQMHSHKDDLWIRDEFWRQDMIQICQEYYPANEAIEKPRAGRHPTTGKALAGIRVGFRRNNFLHMHTEVNNTFVHRQLSTNQSWVLAIDEHQFDIVVMNSGIWMINASSYIDLVTQVHSYMKEHHPHTTVIWRSTQPGHAHCHTFWARPQKRLYDIRDNTGGDARFRWQEADERNRIAKSIWKEEFMDVATMTKLRPDGHMPGECLHYCAPGPHDEWQRILYHHLSLQNPEFIRELEEDQFHASEKVELSAYIAAEDDENRREI